MAVTLSLKGRALKYLSMREHSRLELQQKLAKHASESDDIAALLDTLEAAGWLSAERFVASVVHRKAARYGSARLQQELTRHQLPKTLTQDALGQLRDTEFDRALELWRKRYAHLPAPSTEAERAKQMRFLLGRGFASEIIRKVLKHATQQQAA